MTESEALSRAISQQLAAAVAINTKHGDIPLDDEMRAALDNALRPILKRRLNRLLFAPPALDIRTSDDLFDGTYVSSGRELVYGSRDNIDRRYWLAWSRRDDGVTSYLKGVIDDFGTLVPAPYPSLQPQQ